MKYINKFRIRKIDHKLFSKFKHRLKCGCLACLLLASSPSAAQEKKEDIECVNGYYDFRSIVYYEKNSEDLTIIQPISSRLLQCLEYEEDKKYKGSKEINYFR